jgi:TetR/AcrR family tetracycline transcriptional repressor
LPAPGDDWREWFRENNRSFRRTLLRRRDGARLHAGSFPGEQDLERIAHKMAFLIASGLPEPEAQTAMLAAGRFTVGSVLEEQAAGPGPDHDAAFEAGLALIVDGLQHRLDR